ncbi:cytochrome c3 family protein [Desulfuromonas sp.]|uniref:cytochrome c3 family protein n=1 Tax=Desulfuromonas sp. TaxID=892 RepID=UPI0025BBFC25|nr:cytochrome c3 family protein [Desulfuromonas sp.]
MNYRNRSIPLAAAALITVLATVSWGAPPEATCLSARCHQGLTGTRYLHGPVAAEQVRSGGCVACHRPGGRGCTPAHGGQYSLPAKGLCLTCHDQGSATEHSLARTNCLSCHDPHGTESGPNLLRAGS